MQPIEQQPIGMTLRRDLVIEASRFQGEDCWIVKDPLALKYYRIRKPEYLVLNLLDGRYSLTEIKERLQLELPGQSISLSELHQLIHSFQQQGLLRNPASGQGTVLLERERKHRRRKWLGLLSSVMSLKFPGWDPDRFLTRTLPWVSWLLSPWMTTVFVILMVSAGGLIVTQWDDFYQKMPDFHSFSSGPNLAMLGVLLMMTKAIHELGHAYVCKKFGGHCHEIGVMLLVLMPTLYCNTSDSWIMSQKWKRIAIGGAGMYVELILASICTWVWWMTNPGWLHYVCLNIMFLSSVSTVLFNGNPLLRYDAYYMLSDFLEIPNLSQKSRAAMLDLLRRNALGMEPSQQQWVPHRGRIWFAIYSVASFLYRWFVTFSILWFVAQWFKPYGLEVVGQIMTLVAVSGMVVMPAWQLFRFFEHPGRRRQVKRGRLIGSTLGVGLLVLFVLAVPLPYSLSGSCLIQPADAEKVFIKTTSRLIQQTRKPGDRVEQNQEIIRLDSLPLQLELATLQSREDQLQQLIHQRRRLIQLTNRGKADLSRLLSELADVDNRMQLKAQQLQDLKVVAPRAGVILPAHPVVRPIPADSQSRAEEMEGWWGDLFAPANLGATLTEETQVCWVGEPQRWSAEVYIEQSDIQLVEPGQRVTLQLSAYPGQTLSGVVRAVAGAPLSEAPLTMASTVGGPIEVKADSTTGRQIPIFNWYQVSVDLTDPQPPLLDGLNGQAKVHMPATTLGWRLYRWANVLLRFR